MRTTKSSTAPTLMATKEVAKLESAKEGKGVAAASDAEATTHAQQSVAASRTGFVPFAPRGCAVSNELINHLRDTEGV